MDSCRCPDNRRVRKHTVLLPYRRSLWIPLLAALMGVACGGGNMAQTQGGGPGSSDLSLNTSSIDFGNVAVGSTKSSPVTLTNAASNPGSVTVSAVGVSGTGFSDSAPAVPFTLSPGQSATITVKFSPASAGAATGNLAIQIQGASQPANVALKGTGLAAGQLGVSPAQINFGNVSVGSSQDQTGTLTAGGADVTVSSASWSGDGFSVSGITFPVVVSAGQSLLFTVTFAPQVAGNSTGSVNFISDASNSPTTETWTGTGVQGAQHTVNLSWTASDSNVVGYNVYRGTQAGGPYNTRLTGSPIAATSYTDSSVQSGATYYYVATAVDGSGQESIYSNEAPAVVP